MSTESTKCVSMVLSLSGSEEIIIMVPENKSFEIIRDRM